MSPPAPRRRYPITGTEGFDDVADMPRRGRRDPSIVDEISAALDGDGNEDLTDVQDAEGEGEFALVVGDKMVYKLVVAVPNSDGYDRWFTLGATSSMQPGEDHSGTFIRLVTLVHSGIDEAIADRDAAEVDARAAAIEAARHTRITPARP